MSDFVELIKASDDIEKLMNYLNDNCKDEKESKITGFSIANKVYKWTNEKMSLYPEENLEGKKILTITSSGDHILGAILKGVTNIDSIDINVFSKYYSALKIAMIKKYDHNDFFKNIDLITAEISDVFLIDVLNEVGEYLSKEEFDFWNAYLKYKSGFTPDFFHIYPHDFSCNQYRFKETYDNLKNKIGDVKINYYDGDIIDATKILNGNKYDFIYLSNVIERICKIETRNELLEQLMNILNDNAAIYNYFLGMNCNKLKDEFGECSKILNDKFDFKYYCEYEDEFTCERGIIQMTLR